MRFVDVALALLLMAGVVCFLESASRRFWASRWAKRGYSNLWSQTRPTSIRVAATAVASTVAGVAYGSLSAVVVFGALAWLSSLAISTDLTDEKIPSEPIWVVIWVSVFAIACELAVTGAVNGNPNALFDLIIAEAAVLGVMLFTVVITVGGIGSGDVRLVAALTMTTAWLGAGAVFPAMLIASVGYVLTRKALKIPLGPAAGDGEPVPFAPGLVAGFATTAALIIFSTLLTPSALIA